MKERKNIKFGILRVTELNYSFQDPFSVIEDFKQKTNLEAGLNINYKWNIEDNLFAVIPTFKFAYKQSKEKQIDLLEYSILVEYKVENLADIFLVRSNNDFDFEEKWETTFVSIAISTGRGMLISKTAGTFFRQITFPLVNPSELILSKKLKLDKT